MMVQLYNKLSSDHMEWAQSYKTFWHLVLEELEAVQSVALWYTLWSYCNKVLRVALWYMWSSCHMDEALSYRWLSQRTMELNVVRQCKQWSSLRGIRNIRIRNNNPGFHILKEQVRWCNRLSQLDRGAMVILHNRQSLGTTSRVQPSRRHTHNQVQQRESVNIKCILKLENQIKKEKKYKINLKKHWLILISKITECTPL